VQLLQAVVAVEDVSLHASVDTGGRLLAALSPAAATLRALDFTIKSQDNVRDANQLLLSFWPAYAHLLTDMWYWQQPLHLCHTCQPLFHVLWAGRLPQCCWRSSAGGSVADIHSG
jgi:hypothetical protein